MFADRKGQDYLRDHNIDFVGLAARMTDVLPDKDAKMSLDELKAWFSGSGPAERFKTSDMYKVLKSRGIRRGGAVPLYFLVNNHCWLAEKWECAPNYTPLPLNGSTIEEKFAWWTELQQGMMTQVVETDPEAEYVHISNEPDLVGTVGMRVVPTIFHSVIGLLLYLLSVDWYLISVHMCTHQYIVTLLSVCLSVYLVIVIFVCQPVVCLSVCLLMGTFVCHQILSVSQEMATT